MVFVDDDVIVIKRERVEREEETVMIVLCELHLCVFF